jgi:hypothetical protein
VRISRLSARTRFPQIFRLARKIIPFDLILLSGGTDRGRARGEALHLCSWTEPGRKIIPVRLALLPAADAGFLIPAKGPSRKKGISRSTAALSSYNLIIISFLHPLLSSRCTALSDRAFSSPACTSFLLLFCALFLWHDSSCFVYVPLCFAVPCMRVPCSLASGFLRSSTFLSVVQ